METKYYLNALDIILVIISAVIVFILVYVMLKKKKLEENLRIKNAQIVLLEGLIEEVGDTSDQCFYIFGYILDIPINLIVSYREQIISYLVERIKVFKLADIYHVNERLVGLAERDKNKTFLMRELFEQAFSRAEPAVIAKMMAEYCLELKECDFSQREYVGPGREYLVGLARRRIIDTKELKVCLNDQLKSLKEREISDKNKALVVSDIMNIVNLV